MRRIFRIFPIYYLWILLFAIFGLLSLAGIPFPVAVHREDLLQIPVQLAFLGCVSESDCPDARAASPIFAASADDPPFFIANSSQEKIPIEQSRRFADALRNAGVDTTFVEVPGGLHSIAMLGPSLRARILSFYASTLGADAADSSEGAGAG